MRIYYSGENIESITKSLLDDWKYVFTKLKTNPQQLYKNNKPAKVQNIVKISGILSEWIKPIESTAITFLYKLKQEGLNHFWLCRNKENIDIFLQILQQKNYSRLRKVVESLQNILPEVNKLNFVLDIPRYSVYCELEIDTKRFNDRKFKKEETEYKAKYEKVKLCWYFINFLVNLKLIQKEIRKIIKGKYRPEQRFLLNIDPNIDFVKLKWKDKGNKLKERIIDKTRLHKEVYQESEKSLLRQSIYFYYFLSVEFPEINILFRALTVENVGDKKINDLRRFLYLFNVNNKDLLNELYDVLEILYYFNVVDRVSFRRLKNFEQFVEKGANRHEAIEKLIEMEVKIKRAEAKSEKIDKVITESGIVKFLDRYRTQKSRVNSMEKDISTGLYKELNTLNLGLSRISKFSKLENEITIILKLVSSVATKSNKWCQVRSIINKFEFLILDKKINHSKAIEMVSKNNNISKQKVKNILLKYRTNATKTKLPTSEK